MKPHRYSYKIFYKIKDLKICIQKMWIHCNLIIHHFWYYFGLSPVFQPCQFSKYGDGLQNLWVLKNLQKQVLII